MSTSSALTGTTFVVELTPPGRAAVSVVLVSGPQANEMVGNCFHPKRGGSPAQFPHGRIALGRWGDPRGEELIACRRSNDEIEIHCHGGVAAVNAVIDRLVQHGCQRLTWQDWVRHTSRDRIQSAAHIALAKAPTARTAAILLDQYHGALTTAVQEVAASAASGDWPQALATIDAIHAFRDVGMHLTTPWRVVLAGHTNVGKSSLINALAGFERAIVSHEPGTTRDVVTTATAIDGWPVELADTAGLRETADKLESAGIALATAMIAAADLIVVVHDAAQLSDARTAGGDGVKASILQFPNAARILNVMNKIDLVPASQRRPSIHADENVAAMIPTSALTGEGIDDLISQIGHSLVPSAPPLGTAVPFTAQQVAALESARVAIDRRDAQAATAALQALLPS